MECFTNYITKHLINRKNDSGQIYEKIKQIALGDVIQTDAILLPSISSIEKKIQKRMNAEKQDLTEYEILSFLLYFSCHILKYEANSQYPYHKAVPSTRGIKTTNCYIIEINNKKSDIYEYNIYEHQIIYISSKEIEREKIFNTDENKEKNMIYLIATFDLLQLGRIYGEFAYQLALLDAGHLLGQIRFLLEAINLSYKAQYSFGEQLEIILDLLEKKEYPIWGIQVPLEIEKEKKCIKTFTKIHSSQCDILKYMKDSYEIYMKNQKNVQIEHSTIQQNKMWFDITTVSLLNQIVYNRTSAHNVLGLSSYKINIDIKQLFAEMYKNCECDVENVFQFYIYEGKENIIYKVKDGGFVIVREEICSADLLFQYKTGLTVDSFAYVIFFVVNDKNRRQRAKQDDCFNYLMLKAGEIAQQMSLFFAKEMLFSRPIKNTNEMYIKEVSKGGLLLYTLCVGKSIYRSINMYVGEEIQ